MVLIALLSISPMAAQLDQMVTALEAGVDGSCTANGALVTAEWCTGDDFNIDKCVCAATVDVELGGRRRRTSK
jgi:hypothetical protein